MSETQVLAAPALISEINKINESKSEVQSVAMSSEAAPINEEDLEDGEIDDEDDDDDNDESKNKKSDAIAVPVGKPTLNSSGIQAKDQLSLNEKLNKTENVVTIEISDDNNLSPTLQGTKSKKPKPVEDDHLSSIEHALANALKKKGIEPVAPVLETHDNNEQLSGQQGSSRSSRRRKRKKQREEKEKSKSHSEKKKSRYESPEPSKQVDVVDLDLDEMDDYEMLNVRGGSPPPIGHMPMQLMPPNYNDHEQQSDYESDYSYDSYDSPNDGDSPRNESRRRRRNKKEKKRRERGGRNEKRHRRGDSTERQEPRKLELCKFYLLECCAKRDKCSYMHGDFPCKYYYLGMDCVEKDDCKFSHGEPLTEQLRNILIKHLEMAPKEILGNFKRIPRDQAISMITKRHEELCKEYNVENTWSNLTNLPSNFNRMGKQQQKQQQQQHIKQNKQLQQHQQMQQHSQQKHQQQQQNHTSTILSNIPSLLDMVIKPPNELTTNLTGSNSPSQERQRKSRWNDSTSSNIENRRETALEQTMPCSTVTVGPSYLDIKNLNGILSDEQFSALSSLGIVNLEQVNQLTVGQLNQIGLTIAEINDIQLNMYKNMAKFGGTNSKSVSLSEGMAKHSPKTEIGPSQPSGLNEPLNIDKKTTVQKLQESETFCTNSNSNSSNSGVVMVDYSQYLKDSHLPFDRNDDDERDDEQLIIDDGNAENDESPFGTSPPKSETKKRKDSQSDSEQQQHHRLSVPTLQMSDFGNALRNPFSAMNPFNKTFQDPRINRKDSFERDAESMQKKLIVTADTEESDDERFYNSRGRRSRSRSVTPPPRSGSSTPEASQSPRLIEFGSGATIAKPKQRENPKYERQTMYDFDIKRAREEDEARAAKSMIADKDMRYPEGATSIGGDIDLRLPFLPVTNYTPATEIDASITSHLPMTYKVHEVDVKTPSYVELRLNFKSDQTSDPRLRRILGLPETSQTRTAAAVLSRNVRKLSNTIASPESSDGASPKYYTPPMSSVNDRSHRNSGGQTRTEESTTSATTASAKPAAQQQQQLRLDPRRAARQQAEPPPQNSPPIAQTSTTQPPNNAVKQNVEIRNHLQKSEWYKNLNSKFKIMVNQQLALVSTELKKFHQDPSPNKIFDISFIVNNATLQQILTQLGIFIDDNGEVAHIEADEDVAEVQQLSQSQETTTNNGNNANIMLPNLSQPPPTQQQQQQQPIMEFLRGPPPNILPNPAINLQQFIAPPPNVRPSLLGPPPVVPPRNPFNPFAQNIPINPFVGGPSLLGPGPGAPPMGFNNFNGPPNMQQQQQQQRTFGNNSGNQQRNQRNQRRNNDIGGNNNTNQ